MSDQTIDAQAPASLRKDESKDLRSYVGGAVLALLLTLGSFALIQWPDLPRSIVLIAIAVLGLAQMAVHFRFFLHIGFRQRREDLQLVLFSTLLLVIMVAGTLWIMASFAMRMGMPPSA